MKGGAAVVNDKYDYWVNSNAILNNTSETRWGGVVGVGFEYGFTPNWSFAVEYDHAFLDNRALTFAVAPVRENIRQDLDVVTARINYRFGGPVVAKY